MPRRAAFLSVLLLLMGLLLVAPAEAKCCPLDRLVISGPDGSVTIPAEQLDDQLAPPEQGNLYWPVLNGSSKGDHRPAGNLGPRYDITYVLADTEGEPIQVREVVYLEADPPVAFGPKGQTSELLPGDVREVPWGWRPFPERAANVLLFLLAQPHEASLQGDTGNESGSFSWDALFLPGLLLILGIVAFFFRRRRQAATS